jgi:hypothetical protein
MPADISPGVIRVVKVSPLDPLPSTGLSYAFFTVMDLRFGTTELLFTFTVPTSALEDVIF